MPPSNPSQDVLARSDLILCISKFPNSTMLEDHEVTSLSSNGDHRLCLRFRDGLVAELDFTDCVTEEHGPQTEPLRDATYFSQVWLDDGVLTWPNGYDIAPETLRFWAERGYCG